MSNRKKREIIDVAVEVCTGSVSNEQFGLISTDAVQIGSIGLLEVVKASISSRKVYCTARELAENGVELKTLVLVHFSGGEISKAFWILDGWSLLRSHGEGLDLRGLLLRRANLVGARMKGANLENADLSGSDMQKANLSTANLTGANMAGSNLFSANLHSADLTEAELCRADLRHADLRKSICVRTAFRGADLWGTYMWNVDLSQAFTSGADFQRSDYLNEAISSESRLISTGRHAKK